MFVRRAGGIDESRPSDIGLCGSSQIFGDCLQAGSPETD